MDRQILIIDDDAKLNDLLTTYLGGFGLRVSSATDPEEGLRMIEMARPDLVILDVMLPVMDGFEACRVIRGKHPSLPIIMLTARGDVMDRVVGLELGADDYLGKPFEPRELVARIQSVLRRARRGDITEPKTDTSSMRKFGGLVMDIPRRRVTLSGRVVDLTTGEFEALKLLTDRPGEVLDRDRILESLKGVEAEAYNRAVDITMSRLRQKLGDDPKRPRYIKTVWGAGYAFVGGEEPDGR